MAKKQTTENTAPVYEVISGKENRTIMARGRYDLRDKHSQKTLKYLYELGFKNYIRKNG